MKKVKRWIVMAVVGALLMTTLRGSYDAFTSYAEETEISSENASSAESSSASEEISSDEASSEEEYSDNTNTSYDLKNFLEYGYVTYDGEEIGLEDFTFTPGETYSLALGFAETNDIQFGTLDGTNYFYYELPSGVVPENSSIGGRFSISVNSEGNYYELTDNYYYFDNNTLIVVLNTECYDGSVNVYNVFQETTDAEFILQFTITVDADADEIAFSDSIVGTVEETEPDTGDDDSGTSGSSEPSNNEDTTSTTPGSSFSSSKEVLSISSDKSSVTWKITVVVPETGFDQLNVVDELPSTTIKETGTIYKDSFSRIESIEGLVEGETYSVNSVNYGESGPSYVQISFYKDSNGTQGLIGTGEKRTIVIVITTDVNQDWVNANVTDHTNKAWVIGTIPGCSSTSYTKYATAVILGDQKAISKSYIKSGTNTDGSVYYKYYVVLTNVSTDEITISDHVDLNLFDLDESSIKVTGGNTKKWPGNSINANITTSSEKTDSGLDFTITASGMEQSGSFYPYYMIEYNLVVPVEKVSLLQQKANASTIEVDGNTVPGLYITNAASWEGLTATDSNAKYVYSGVKKAQTQTPNASNGFTCAYKITINPSAMDLNAGGDTLTLKDEATNLKYDLSSVVVYNGNGENITSKCSISLDSSGCLVMIVPDSTALTITYKARVLESGAYTNTVSLLGYTSKTSATCSFTTSGTGSATVKMLNIYKYDEEDSTIGLQGAVFKLYKESNGEIVAVTNRNNEDVTFTTDENGRAVICGKYVTDGWTLYYNTQYYIKEITAPVGYKLSSELIPFMITRNSSAAVTNIYANADTLMISNAKDTENEEDPTTDPTPATSTTTTTTTTSDDSDSSDDTETTETATVTVSQEENFYLLAPIPADAVEDPEVLGAMRRADTSDTTNTSARIMIIILAAFAGIVLILSGKKKKV